MCAVLCATVFSFHSHFFNDADPFNLLPFIYHNNDYLGTKLMINTRLSKATSAARQGDKMLRLLCVNFAEQATSSSSNNRSNSGQDNSNNEASTIAASSSAGLLSALKSSHAGTGNGEASSTVVPQTYLLKTKDAKVLFLVRKREVCGKYQDSNSCHPPWFTVFLL